MKNDDKKHFTFSQKKSSTRHIGNRGERIAKDYLEQQGLIFLTAQYHKPWGEIDLIMLDQEDLVFVEVRYREDRDYGDPHETITSQKRKRLIKTALSFQQQYPWTNNYYLRIDVIGIYGNKLKNIITWIPNAIELA